VQLHPPVNQKTPELPLAAAAQVAKPASITATSVAQQPPVPGDAQPPAKKPAIAEGRKAPPPPPKRPPADAGRLKSCAAAPASSPKVPAAATVFTPTNLRTKKVSQVAGGVLQVSSSLSHNARKKVLLTETPRMQERVDLDEAYDDLMKELG